MYLQRGKWPIFFRRYRVEAFFVKAGSEYNCAVQSLEFCQTSTLMDGLLLRNTEVRGAAKGNMYQKRLLSYPDFTKTKAKLSSLETF